MPWPLSTPGGVTFVIETLLKGLSSEDVATVFVEAGKIDTPLSLRSPWGAHRPVRHLIAFLGHLPSTLLRIRRFAREREVKVFNAHFPDLSCLNLTLAKRLGFFDGQVALSLHGSDIRKALQSSGFERRLYKLLYRTADVIVPCSGDLGQEALMLEPRCNVVSIPNGIDIPSLAASADRDFTLPEELRGRRLLMNVAAFEYRKGHDILLTAFQKISAQFPDTALVLIGRPADASAALKKMIQEAGLEGNIFIYENVPRSRVVAFLQHASIFVFASRWIKGVMGEGMPLGVLEAGAFGLPVVSTATCGINELLEDNVSGRVTPLEDANALADAIAELLQAPEKSRQYGEALQARLKSSFRLEDNITSYARLFGVR